MRSGFFVWLLGAAVWIALLAGGWYALLQHEFTAGPGASVPERWPADSTLPLDRERPSLILFAHRSCPCTRATLGELEQILVHAPGAVSACVVFITPPGATEDRVGEDMEHQARSLPGTQVVFDPTGAEARRFRVRTSGHVVLFGADGHLRFSGGITDARGHAGESAGRQAILEWLRGERAGPRTAPVYGCSLFGVKEEGESWDR